MNQRRALSTCLSPLFLLSLTLFSSPVPLTLAADRTEWQLDTISFTNELARMGGSSTVVVAIIDGGVDFTHKDLGEQLRWRNSDEIPGNGLDDDNNGYIDDVYGWNFVDQTNNTAPVRENRDDNNNGWFDEQYSHGTFIAGIIAGQGKRIRGLVPNIRILDVKAFNSDGTAGDLVAAWKYVESFGNNISVINFSASMSEDVYQQVIPTLDKLVHDHGVVVVAASGNADPTDDLYEIALPANHTDVLSVGAVGRDLTLTNFSRRGSGLDLVAPGERLFSTVPDDLYEDAGSGTSYAAPFVTGAVAYLRSLPTSTPLTTDDIRGFVTNTTTDLGPAGYDAEYGHGLLNMTTLVAAVPTKESHLAHWELLGPSFLLASGAFTILKKRRRI